MPFLRLPSRQIRKTLWAYATNFFLWELFFEPVPGGSVFETFLHLLVILLLELLRFSSNMVLSMTLNNSSLSTIATCRTKPELSLHSCLQEKIRAKKGRERNSTVTTFCETVKNFNETNKKLGALNTPIRDYLHSCVGRETQSKEQIGAQAWRSANMKVRHAFSRDLEPNACAFGESKWIANNDWKHVDTVYRVNTTPRHYTCTCTRSNKKIG